MKKLGTIEYDNFSFDDAVQVVTEQFNELKRSNPTVTYKDINITFGFFRRTWVVLVYEYDDQAFGTAEVNYDEMPPLTKSQWIGIPDGIDPRDPHWREKLAAHEAKR